MFAGITDREMVEAVAVEMRRRNLTGCIFVFPGTGGPSAFASSSPSGTLCDLTAAQQLAVFAGVATTAIAERSAIIPDGEDTSFDPKGWVN
jgi:hypothetical protein